MPAPYHQLATRALPGFGLAFMLPILAGCAPGTGTVSGKITYNGKPLPGAIVMFQPAAAGQNPVTLALDAESRYSVTLPTGEVSVTVNTRDIVPKVSMKMPAPGPEPDDKAKGGPEGGADAAKGDGDARPAGNRMPIPDRYAKVETSGLKYTVKSGNQTYDIDLKD
jgi:hypothetical protein